LKPTASWQAATLATGLRPSVGSKAQVGSPQTGSRRKLGSPASQPQVSCPRKGTSSRPVETSIASIGFLGPLPEGVPSSYKSCQRGNWPKQTAGWPAARPLETEIPTASGSKGDEPRSPQTGSQPTLGSPGSQPTVPYLRKGISSKSVETSAVSIGYLGPLPEGVLGSYKSF
jgi:hypothetical protein